MGMIREFKEFAVKGNVLDMAIGVVIGAAFGKIVNSLIEDVITPMVLQPALDAAHLTSLHDLSWHGVKYGLFLSSIINFVMVAWVLFMIVKAANAAKKKEAAAPAPPAGPTQEQLLTEIRDLLAKK
ncbi:MAG: large conductance mechanosensitive channel protein MscL [Bacteroidia bacterium]|jgi:large conductance mechanosensitive channel